MHKSAKSSFFVQQSTVLATRHNWWVFSQSL